MKNVQFLHPPLPSFSVCPNESELPRPPAPWHQNLGYQPPPYPHSLWYSCSISIVFSRSFHQIPCNSQLFTKKLKQTCLTWNAKNKTKMLSKSEPDTYLQHCFDNNTNYSSEHPISKDPLPPCYHPLPSEFWPFFSWPSLSPIYWMS